MTIMTGVSDTAMFFGGGDKHGVRGWITETLAYDADDFDIDAIHDDVLVEWQSVLHAYRPDWSVTAAIVIAPLGYEPLSVEELADLRADAGERFWQIAPRHAS